MYLCFICIGSFVVRPDKRDDLCTVKVYGCMTALDAHSTFSWSLVWVVGSVERNLNNISMNQVRFLVHDEGFTSFYPFLFCLHFPIISGRSKRKNLSQSDDFHESWSRFVFIRCEHVKIDWSTTERKIVSFKNDDGAEANLSGYWLKANILNSHSGIITLTWTWISVQISSKQIGKVNWIQSRLNVYRISTFEGIDRIFSKANRLENVWRKIR